MKRIMLATLFTLLISCSALKTTGLGNYFQNDEATTTAVQAAFYNDPQLSGVPIHIETHQGRVQLSGYVKTIKQSDVAFDVASKAQGVKEVQNDLIVRK